MPWITSGKGTARRNPSSPPSWPWPPRSPCWRSSGSLPWSASRTAPANSTPSPPTVADMATQTREQEAPAPKAKRSFQFPSAVTTLVIVTLLVWIAALFIPSGVYKETPDGAPIPGSWHQVPSPLSFGGKLSQLILAPVNGTYGLKNPTTGVVDTETLGRLFGQIGVIFFIMAIGAFISVSFSTKALDTAIAALASRLRSKGWLLITAVMVLFSLLGSTMGFSVETLGFYALFIPLMTALGYDRMVTAAMIILGRWSA